MKVIHANAPFMRRGQHSLRNAISRLVLGTGTSLLVASPLQAASSIEEIIIRDSARDSYVVEQSSISKFTETLSDTPQSITVLTESLLQDRGVTSLDDALRNVPGITLGAGEMSWQGNSPTIRGFSSRNDMFLDGMRDFGNYYRDPFNLSSVEVLQGPSSMAFGRGSTGGVINQSTKTPLREELRSLHLNVGNADTRRLTADLNQPFSDNVAGRLNLMYHDADVPQRDGAHSERYGIAPSLSIGLGDATQLTLTYMKLNSDDVPDYGVPWLGTAPAPVDRETYYGYDDDYIETDVDVATLQLDHLLTDNTRLQALVRLGNYDRSTRITEAQITSPAGTPLDQIQVRRFMFQGESTEDIVQGQLNLISEFNLAGLEHALVAGLEVARENSDPQFGFPQGVPDTSLVNPTGTYSQTSPGLRLRSDNQVDTLAGFVLDTVKFNEQWQVMAGLRWDRFDIDYNAVRYNDGVFDRTESIDHTDIETSWRLALVYKPVENGTLYVGAGTSFNPSGEGLSFINSGRNLTISDAFLEPENNRTVEVGTKWELLNSSLLVDAAVFHIVKSNARVPDPTTPGFNILGGEQTVDGFSINVTGRLTQQLSVNAGYAYLDSEQGRSLQAALVPGTPLVNVPENSFSGWVNYAFTPQLEMGLGARFVDDRLATNTTPAKAVSDYWAFDAMAKYRVNNNLSLKLNLTNFTDEFYYDQLHSWHVVPGPGLGAVFAINLDY
ncbi:MAG TPA: TonB-dependent siderophore receptor [Hyphomicrobiales bacterium]|nr:TonB-dependent siderophore receptor [Hyphomicrobiales bacterium]